MLIASALPWRVQVGRVRGEDHVREHVVHHFGDELSAEQFAGALSNAEAA